MNTPDTTVVPAASVSPSSTLMRGLLITSGLGVVAFLAGMLVDPERVWGGYLMGFFYFVGLALAGPLFLSVLYLSGARWSLPLRRIPEAMGGALPAAMVLGLVLIMGTHALYQWSHSQVVAGDALLQHKAPWLNTLGFSFRMVVYFLVWIWIARKVAARSTSTEAEPERTRGNIRASALFGVILAVTFSLASIDWIQSLDAHWFSTIFALRTLSGVGCSGLALATIVLVVLRRKGPMRSVVTKDVMDDLGKLLLGLSLFWAYIWYCQYMIIWYMNMPEETGYYLLRREGDWGTLAPVNLIVNFAVPFLALMLRSWRRNGTILIRIAAWVLVGHAFDLYVMIAPPILGNQPSLGLWELGPLVGALAFFGWIFLRGLSRHPVIAGYPRSAAHG